LYEREIIKILLVYGNCQIDFVDWVEEVNEFGVVKMVKDEYSNMVSQELYLQLQDDEVEFSHGAFRKIYIEIITKLNIEQNISIEELTSHQDAEISQTVTDILMDDEKHILSDWEAQGIYVSTKEENLPKDVTDVILRLRNLLIEKKINELKTDIQEKSQNINTQLLEEIMNYSNLKIKLNEKLNRVV
jgi:DNA primase